MNESILDIGFSEDENYLIVAVSSKIQVLDLKDKVDYSKYEVPVAYYTPALGYV
jgi:hypothetical protein